MIICSGEENDLQWCFSVVGWLKISDFGKDAEWAGFKKWLGLVYLN